MANVSSWISNISSTVIATGVAHFQCAESNRCLETANGARLIDCMTVIDSHGLSVLRLLRFSVFLSRCVSHFCHHVCTVHSFIYAFILSFICLFSHSLFRPFTRSLIPSLSLFSLSPSLCLSLSLSHTHTHTHAHTHTHTYTNIVTCFDVYRDQCSAISSKSTRTALCL